ncbi:MAG: nucleotide exchange factor GrpE [bacterium]
MSEKNKDSKNNSAQDLINSAQEEKIAEQQIYKETLEEKNKEIASYHDQLLRLKADFENYRKRSEREKSEYLAWGKQDILMNLMTLKDVLEQAHTQAASTDNIESVVQGLELLYKEFEKFLKAEGLQVIETLGQVFDPHFHEAIGYIESESGTDGEIIEELQKGYSFKNRIIRPAKVKVTKLKRKKCESEKAEETSTIEKEEEIIE